VLGVLLAVAGIGALIAGVALQLLIVGVVGFALMFGGVLLAITPGKRGAATPAPAEPTAGSSKAKRSGGGFMDRLNDRWDRRQEGRD
jgi:fatty acid desaturase